MAARAGGDGVPPTLSTVRLVDHHCHGVVRRDLDLPQFEVLLTEADGPGGRGFSRFDSHIGFAVRRWCAPILDLASPVTAEEYLERRAELGAAEVTRRFLTAARLEAMCVDTGYTPEPLLSPAELGEAAGAPAYEVIRLESVAEQTIRGGCAAGEFADAVRRRLADAAGSAIAVKSIAAYRVGLDLPGDPPTAAEVAAAAGRVLASAETSGAGPDRPLRLVDPVLHRFLIWAGVELGRPVQIHTGYGDRDVDLHRCNPVLLTELLRAIEPTGVPVVLLHTYPYHREAGYLAQVMGNVYVDVSLATHNLGARSNALIAEALELVPFGKFLYASDAYGLPELYYLGAFLFRRGLERVLREGLADDVWTETEAARLAELMGAGNARRIYRLP
jgi:predicted TIM-barrel fold metal-dependent hydrolase